MCAAATEGCKLAWLFSASFHTGRYDLVRRSNASPRVCLSVNTDMFDTNAWKRHTDRLEQLTAFSRICLRS
jgi:hypothetical protein